MHTHQDCTLNICSACKLFRSAGAEEVDALQTPKYRCQLPPLLRGRKSVPWVQGYVKDDKCFRLNLPALKLLVSSHTKPCIASCAAMHL